MVFKLIRIDADEPSKIELLVGKHVIGRGKLHIDSSDKRVSRNHAELEVTDDYVGLKSLHQNPCFFIKKDTVNREILEQNQATQLSNGDKFGLIPDNLWFELVYGTNSENLSNVTKDTKGSNVQNGDGEISNEMTQIGDGNEQTNAGSSTEDEAVKFNMNDDVEEPNRSASPSLLNTQPADIVHTDTAPSSPNKQSNKSRSPSPADVIRVKTEPGTTDATADTVPMDPAPLPNKRSNESPSSSPDVKRVKTEPGTTGQAGPSNDQAASNDDNDDQKPNINAAAPVTPAAPLRERCMYGANCYRRNPQHKAQFSHPTDSDWGAGARGTCPYGALCRRLDPRHWQLNDHPPGVCPPPPTVRRPGQDRIKRRKPRVVSDSEDEDDSTGSDLIVTGKRTRKVVQTNIWADSQSDEEDPYNTDGESDEWQPNSDVTNSEDFSQNF